ncbi:hypothetical protein [Thermoactinomyces sp. CICC 10522]|uniref:hypothetical protein n=1 Tax=Thermoactinomyces sp. CICC 10522 TaxID=2767427 RepID=UPI0018DC82A3|nr:hypothetical protein [Thermoactinomyces sp. CICC 10522]MBH8604235.1 hypothetical protein [Thermoactinomyces sp. CICC 10522]
MKPHTLSIPYSVVDKLPAAERFVYYELCRLAAYEDMTDEDFKIPLSKGELVTSHYRLAKVLDYPYSKAALAIESLEKKGLIEISMINDPEFKTYYVVHIKKIVPDDQPIENEVPYANQDFYWDIK